MPHGTAINSASQQVEAVASALSYFSDLISLQQGMLPQQFVAVPRVEHAVIEKPDVGVQGWEL